MVAINLLAVILYLISNWWILRRTSGDRILLGYLLVLQSWSVVSCFYNDCGVYNFELFRFTETTLATTRLVLVYLCFNAGALFVASQLRTRGFMLNAVGNGRRSLQQYLRPAVLGGAAVLLVSMLGAFATGGIPILQGLHKLSYAEAASPVERLFLTHGFILLFLVGWVRKKARHDITDLVLAGFLLYLLGAGHKFSQLIYVTACYLIAPVGRMILVQRGEAMKRRLRILIPVALCALLAISFGNYLIGTEDDEFARAVLLDRVLGNQGHLWWGTDQAYWTTGAFESGHWNTELNSAASGFFGAQNTSVGTTGMSYLMLNLLGPEKAYPIFDTGYLYTMAYPAIAQMSIGFWLTLILQLFWGAVFMLLSSYLLQAVRQGYLLRALLALLLLVPLITATFSGSLATIFTVGMLVKLVLMIILESGIRLPISAHRPVMESAC